ncbi:PEP-utilizing enzyme [Bacillus cereus]
MVIKDGRISEITNSTEMKLLQGKTASLGKAEGMVYVINNVLDRSCYNQIPENSIVVAPVLSPSLTYNLLSVSAIITETGGFFSHGAIFAREKGIPAIVSVNSVMSILNTSDVVRIDADSGMIEK